jgi:hypothetical protein
MRRWRQIIGLATVVVAAALAVAPTAGADRGGVLKQGRCSVSSSWKLTLKHDDGRIETEFEVDQNRVGRRWSVVLIRNGRTVFRGIRTTRAPSGSFELGRLVANGPGADRIVARARSLAGGEVCQGAASIA